MKDRKALITGGTGGLGAAVTLRAVASGARVWVTYVLEEERDALASRLPSDAGVTFLQLDLTDEAAVVESVRQIGDLAILIHLVGGFAMGPTDTFALSDYAGQVAINLTSTFIASKTALATMRQSGYGRIVTIGSRSALEGGANTAAYAASKAGVVALTRAIADETRTLDVTANCVLPSVIDTPANRRAMPDADTSRWVTPADLAEAICFLASTAAGRLRGAAVPVYGDV